MVDRLPRIVLSYIRYSFLSFCLKGNKMAYVINKDDCIQCGACESECPDGAISEVDGYYVIDPEKCKDCGSCSEVCPSSAISPA
jgi:ferredoxin